MTYNIYAIKLAQITRKSQYLDRQSDNQTGYLAKPTQIIKNFLEKIKSCNLSTREPINKKKSWSFWYRNNESYHNWRYQN